MNVIQRIISGIRYRIAVWRSEFRITNKLAYIYSPDYYCHLTKWIHTHNIDYLIITCDIPHLSVGLFKISNIDFGYRDINSYPYIISFVQIPRWMFRIRGCDYLFDGYRKIIKHPNLICYWHKGANDVIITLL